MVNTSKNTVTCQACQLGDDEGVVMTGTEYTSAGKGVIMKCRRR